MTCQSPSAPRCYWNCGATFSPCRTWRYSLWRNWRGTGRELAVCSLNPSTADEHEDDRTISRDIGFAQRWGFTGLVKINLFAFRSTDPSGLLDATDPIGPENDAHILEVVAVASRVVMAWGSHRKSAALAMLVESRAAAVEVMLRRHVRGELGTFGAKRNADGQPKHPLYLSNDTPFVAVPR